VLASQILQLILPQTRKQQKPLLPKFKKSPKILNHNPKRTNKKENKRTLRTFTSPALSPALRAKQSEKKKKTKSISENGENQLKKRRESSTTNLMRDQQHR